MGTGIVKTRTRTADGVLYGTVELLEADRIVYAIPGFDPVAYLAPDPTDRDGLGVCL